MQSSANKQLIVERELKFLRSKVKELSQENLALREINIKFQLENYKLQQKINSFEKSQVELATTATDNAFEWNDVNYDSNVEYLEETYDPAADTISTKDLIEIDPQVQDDSIKEVSNQIKTDRSETRDDEDTNLEDIFSEDELSIFKSHNLDPKHATKVVYTIAANKGVLDKLKSIQGIRAKDSYFVNKMLDILYGREVLASSSARGQKCQSQSHLPPRPALDETKLRICRQAFVYRLMSAKLSSDVFEERLKAFNSYVNFKIQNSRKLFMREQKRTLINDQ